VAVMVANDSAAMIVASEAKIPSLPMVFLFDG